ncbi:MAG: hypothetical protein U7126_22425 [Microcoleus sp.]
MATHRSEGGSGTELKSGGIRTAWGERVYEILSFQQLWLVKPALPERKLYKNELTGHDMICSEHFIQMLQIINN